MYSLEINIFLLYLIVWFTGIFKKKKCSLSEKSAFLIYMTTIKLGRFGINITIEINVVSR